MKRTEVAESNDRLAPGADAGKVKLRTENLRALFGDFEAVRGISLDIIEHSVLAIIGPSGCGKSTFLRCINRMHELVPGTSVKGRVVIDGIDIYDPKVNPVRVRRHIGMVFQKPNPFPTMSIRDNVLAGLRLQGIRANDPEEIVEKALRRAALWDEVKDVLDRSGASLSGGQQQRLCIARSLALEPEVLLMDVPASALAPIATQKIAELIYELKKSVTIVIVTHNMQQAARVSDRTAFFMLGEVVEVDDTNTIFMNPENELTEDYVTGRFG
ncbi:MAG: phosphate ABC transporter ATP-binding protein PstB [Thermoanaerobaculia bacterium]|nr:phosphate ABC transporter ATP-binding protein PstB [Thermoanaerobaculia bacterium]